MGLWGPRMRMAGPRVRPTLAVKAMKGRFEQGETKRAADVPENWAMRWGARRGLWRMGFLEDAMTMHATVVWAVIVGVGSLWAGGCSDPEKDLGSPDQRKVMEAVRKVAERRDDQAVDQVAKVVGHQDTMVAATGVRTLGMMRRARAVKILTEIASGATEKRSAVRQEAVIQLGSQKDPEALNTLRQVIKADPDPRVRAAAATSLSRQHSLPDVALLVQVAEAEQDPVVQARAVGSVERLIGLKFGYDPQASPAERQKALLRMRSIALTAAAGLEDARRNKKGRK
jgi:hypothetical protein